MMEENCRRNLGLEVERATASLQVLGVACQSPRSDTA